MKNKRIIKCFLILVVVIFVIIRIIAWMIIIYLLISFRMFTSGNGKQSDVKRNVAEKCEDIYGVYQSREYETIEITTAFVDDDVTVVTFEDKAEGQADLKEVNDTREVLYGFLCNTEESNEGFYKLSFKWHVNSGLIYSYEISNFADAKAYPALEEYGENNGWWINRMSFENWQEMERYFYNADGINRCRIFDMESISNADPARWGNLKYISISYSGDDVEVYEEMLKRLFPNCEVTIG